MFALVQGSYLRTTIADAQARMVEIDAEHAAEAAPLLQSVSALEAAAAANQAAAAAAVGEATSAVDALQRRMDDAAASSLLVEYEQLVPRLAQARPPPPDAMRHAPRAVAAAVATRRVAPRRKMPSKRRVQAKTELAGVRNRTAAAARTAQEGVAAARARVDALRTRYDASLAVYRRVVRCHISAGTDWAHPCLPPHS